MNKSNKISKDTGRVFDELSSWLSKQKYWAGLVILVCWGLYYSGLPNGAVGLGESDLFLLTADRLSQMKSPGYPVYLLLTHVFSLMPITWLTQAGRMHLFSVVLGGLATGMVFVAGWNGYELWKPNQSRGYKLGWWKFERWLMAISGSLIYGTAGIVWRNYLLTEKHALTGFFMSLWLVVVTSIISGEKREKKWWVLAIILGLGVSHQWVFVSLLPVSFWLWWKKHKQENLVSAGGQLGVLLAAAVLPFVMMVQVFDQTELFAWRVGSNLTAIAEFVLANYWGDGLARGGSLSQIFSQTDVRLLVANMWTILGLVVDATGAWVILLVMISWFLPKSAKAKDGYMFLVWSLLSLWLALALILNWDEGEVITSPAVYQLGALYGLLALLAMVGFLEVIRRLGGALVILFPSKRVHAGLLALVVLPTVWIGYVNSQVMAIGDMKTGEKLYKHILMELEEDSLLACFSFNSCYGLMYQQQAVGVRPDVAIVPFYYAGSDINFDASDYQLFDYGTYPWVMYDIVTASVLERPTYSVAMFNQYEELFDFDFGFLHKFSYGYVEKLQHGLPDELPELNTDFSDEVVKIRVADWDAELQLLMVDLMKQHLRNAHSLMQANMRAEAFRQSNLASELVYLMEQKQIDQFDKARKSIESEAVNEHFSPGVGAADPSAAIAEIDQFVEVGLVSRAIRVSRGAVTLEPKNVEARLRWAELLEETYASDSAVVEYQNVLSLDPDNQQAKDRLEYQDNLR